MIDRMAITIEAGSLEDVTNKLVNCEIDYAIQYQGGTMSIIRIYNISSVEVLLDSVGSPELVIYVSRDTNSIKLPLNIMLDFRLF